MQKKNKTGAKPVPLRIQNPGPHPPVLPGERKTMAKTKNKSAAKTANKKSGSRQPNKAGHGSKSAGARKSSTATGRTSNKASRRKKHHHHRNTGLARVRNSLDFSGVNVVDLAVGGLALIGTTAVAQLLSPWVNPQSWLGLGLQGGMVVGIAKVVPKQYRAAAVIGAGATPTANLINKATGNVIGSTIQSWGGRFLPAPPATPAGVSGFRRPGVGGIVAVPPGYARYTG